ncbi:hypothetical protein [Streptococcus dentiloxodontae]
MSIIKKLTYFSILSSSILLLTACQNQKQTSHKTTTNTEKTVSPSSKTNTASSSAATFPKILVSDGVYEESDGKVYTVSKGGFVLEQTTGSTANYQANGSYTIEDSDGTHVIKSVDGSYTIETASGVQVIFNKDTSYAVTLPTSSTHVGTGNEELEAYLTENGIDTINSYDRQIADIIHYLNNNYC